MTRTPPPHRRPNATRDVEHMGHSFTVTIGFDAEGRPKEVFGDAQKVGQGLSYLITDACITVSIALQHGASPAELLKSYARVPLEPWQGIGTRPASVLGTIVEAVQAEAGP